MFASSCLAVLAFLCVIFLDARIEQLIEEMNKKTATINKNTRYFVSRNLILDDDICTLHKQLIRTQDLISDSHSSINQRVNAIRQPHNLRGDRGRYVKAE